MELRSPDGSAIIHLLLAGMAMAAEWGFQDSRTLFGDSGPLELADKLYVKGNIITDPELVKRLPSLPTSCVESRPPAAQEARALRAGRHLPARASSTTWPRLLEKEKDEDMNSRLADLPADDRLHETRRIMHKDLHRH